MVTTTAARGAIVSTDTVNSTRKSVAVHTGFHCGVKLGLVEATNGKVALLRREARGFRDPEYFKLKIFQRCSLPSNPWADVAL